MSVREQLPDDGLDIGDSRLVWESRVSGFFYISLYGHWLSGAFNTFEAAERSFWLSPYVVQRLLRAQQKPLTLVQVEQLLKEMYDSFTSAQVEQLPKKM